MTGIYFRLVVKIQDVGKIYTGHVSDSNGDDQSLLLPGTFGPNFKTIPLVDPTIWTFFVIYRPACKTKCIIWTCVS